MEGFSLNVNGIEPSHPPYIPKDGLVRGRWYHGKGRNSDVALWNGDVFLTFGSKFDEYVEKREGHWDDGGPFKPQEELI